MHETDKNQSVDASRPDVSEGDISMSDALGKVMPKAQTNFPRTLFLSHWFPLASETFVFYEIEGLYKRDLPVSVITLYAQKHKNLAKHIRETAVPIEHFGMAKTGHILWAFAKRFIREPKKSFNIVRTLLFRRWRNAEMYLENLWATFAGFYLADKVKERGIEHIHAAWANGPTTAAWVVQQLDAVPYSFSVHAGDIRPQDGFLKQKLESAMFARANIRFNIPYLASFVDEKYHDKLYLVHNVSTLKDCPPAKVSMQTPFALLAIGRLIETKGFQYLIDAVGILQKRGIQVKLSIIGSGAWMSKLQKRIQEQNLEKNVQMLGFVTHDAISEHLLQSDIFVMPSIVKEKVLCSDGLPNVVMEAMQHSVPVVATDIAGMRDAVIDGETGYLVPERDAKALADAIAKVIENRENALQMAKNAKELVTRTFDSDANLDKLSHLITAYTLKK